MAVPPGTSRSNVYSATVALLQAEVKASLQLALLQRTVYNVQTTSGTIFETQFETKLRYLTQIQYTKLPSSSAADRSKNIQGDNSLIWTIDFMKCK